MLKIIFLFFVSVFVFSCIEKTDKQQIVEKQITGKVEEISSEEIVYNPFILGEMEYKYIPSIDENSSKEELASFLEKMVAEPFHYSLDYLSEFNVDIAPLEGATWFTSFYVYDSMPARYYWLYLYIIKDGDLKQCRVPFVPYHHAQSYIESLGEQMRGFSVLGNLEGRFNRTAWLYDVNEDGFDEIIGVDDDEGSQSLTLYVIGYDKEQMKFVDYLKIKTVILDMEKGPEPVQYVEQNGKRGFKCLVDLSTYTPLYKPVATEERNSAWCFFVWDEDNRKYVEELMLEE